MAMGLAAAGAAAPAIVAFVIASQSAGLDSLLFTVGVLGPAAAIWRMVAAGLIAVATGLAMPRTAAVCGGQQEQVTPKQADPLARKLASSLREVFTTSFDDVAVSVGIGFTLTSALVAWLPPGGLGAAAAIGGVGGRAAVLAVALPMQFCEHASVPLAAALQTAGASGGLAFATLATMPSMNLASFGVVAHLGGSVAAVRVVAVLWLCGFLGSFAGDWAGVQVSPVGHGHGMLPSWYETASRWVMIAIAVCAVVRLISRKCISTIEPEACCGSSKPCKAD